MEEVRTEGTGRAVRYQFPGLLVYEDGSVERGPQPSQHFICHGDGEGLATKDVIINPRKHTWARIFLPHSVAHRSTASSGLDLAPLVLHFHGGGMCLGSPAEPKYHNFCSRLAFASKSICISVYYRLAPEHRLPAQYQDCFEALCWLHSQFVTTKCSLELNLISTSGQTEPWELEKDDLIAYEKEPWVVDHGDATRIFCIGESAGATILHFAALKMVKHDWRPLTIRGLMFVDLGILTDVLPETTPLTDPGLTSKMLADSVALSLPYGLQLGDAILDCLHPYSKYQFELQWPPIILFSAERDLLQEGVLKYYNILKEAGKDVELHDSRDKGHCFHLVEFNSEAARLRESAMVQFIKKHS